MAIHLIRHGETASNRQRVLQIPETPLSQNGLAQAALMAKRLARAGITRILASDYARAYMTATRLAEATGVPVESEPLLRERNFGALRGVPYAELSENPFGPGFSPPEGEDWATFHARVDRAWARVAQVALETEGELAVVTHGLVLHSIVLRHVDVRSGEPAEGASVSEVIAGAGIDGPPLRFGNTAVTTVAREAPWRVSLFGCTAHLDADTADDPESISGL